MTRRDWIATATIVIAFAAAVAITDPRGNFPLDDDWDFTLTTWNLVQNGTIQHTPFTSAVAVLQYLWGALWTVVFGMSCTVLRASTLTLSLATTLLVYGILRRLEVRETLALFAALAFFFHPLIFWASFTYMTHIPELFVSVAAFALFVEAQRRQTAGWIAAAAIVAAASFFVRQIGILNALAPLIGVLWLRPPRWKVFAAWYGTAVALFAVLMATGVLIVSRQEAGFHLPPTGLDLFEGAAHYGFFNVQYAALFSLPLVLCVVPVISRATAGRIAAATLWFVAIAVHMLLLRRPIPYPARGNVFVNFGLGPPTLRDTFVFLRPHPFHLGYAWLVVLMVVSTALAILLASLKMEHSFMFRVALIYCICGTLIHMFQRIYFDRYSIDTMWPVAILIPLSIARVPKVAVVALAVVALFAVSGTAEYLSWNRARWTAYRWLQSRGVTLDQMDGGYEINALLAVRRGRKDLGKPGFGVADDRYILTFGEVPGYKTLATFPYHRLLGRDGEVRVLAR